LLKYTNASDDVQPSLTDADSGAPQPTSLERDHLRSLDAELAPYPFARLATWKDLTNAITPADVHRVTRNGLVDSLMESSADGEHGQDLNEDAAQLNFPAFDIKRSWRTGAVGEEITRFSRDLSWLWCEVVTRQYATGE
jgi:A1 cistron-splicing factor AAR2